MLIEDESRAGGSDGALAFWQVEYGESSSAARGPVGSICGGAQHRCHGCGATICALEVWPGGDQAALTTACSKHRETLHVGERAAVIRGFEQAAPFARGRLLRLDDEPAKAGKLGLVTRMNAICCSGPKVGDYALRVVLRHGQRGLGSALLRCPTRIKCAARRVTTRGRTGTRAGRLRRGVGGECR